MSDFSPSLQFSDAEKLANWLSLTTKGREVMNMVLTPLVPPVHKKRLPRFTSTDSLSFWLQATNDGYDLLNAIFPSWLLLNTKAMEYEIRAEVDRRLNGYASVLIVCHPDGFSEAYSKDASVHFASLLDTTEEILAEKYLEMRLPKRFRELFYPRNSIGCHYIEHRTASQELRIRGEIQIIRDLKGIRQ